MNLLEDELEMMYTWFKEPKIVDHLMAIATRYVRSYLYRGANASEVEQYLRGWIARFEAIRSRLDDYVARDDALQATENFLREIGFLSMSVPIQAVLETELDWCITYFRECTRYLKDRSTAVEAFPKFVCAANELKQTGLLS